MLTLEAVRTAALAAQPYTALDALIQVELRAGRSLRDIAAEYEPLMIAVADNAMGLSMDGGDALGGILDKLTGMCHRNCQY